MTISFILVLSTNKAKSPDRNNKNKDYFLKYLLLLGLMGLI